MNRRKVALVYSSIHGHTRKVVDAAVDVLQSKVEVFEASSRLSLSRFERFLIFCPTYGDEELAAGMEGFLTSLRLRDRQFAICELGNYYGYEDPEFGPRRILRPRLRALGWKEFFRPVSVDSLPVIDWPCFSDWVGRLDRFLA